MKATDSIYFIKNYVWFHSVRSKGTVFLVYLELKSIYNIIFSRLLNIYIYIYYLVSVARP